MAATRDRRKTMGTKVVVVAACLISTLPIASPIAHAGHECRDNPPAGTNCAKTTTSIRYREESNRFAGRVESHMTYCVRRRAVTLYRERPGTDATIATTRTGRSGRWYFPGFDDPEGRFYAVARYRDRAFGIDGAQICYRGLSKTIKV